MLDLPFDNSYARLPKQFYTKTTPTEVSSPALIALNTALSDRLGLDPKTLKSNDGIAMLAGNLVPESADPLAQAYGGHQFGNWAGRLGDGRAVLLGEIVAPDGARFDLQLKGSGPTPYSRNGDGRAWLGPVLREYLVSEAMAALDVPTTRALAAVSTGELVRREKPLPGAVLTRVAASHMRVGTFQYFASVQDPDGMAELAEYARARHYPDADGPLGLLKGVIAAQTELIAKWMGIGFVHGVMNTDNMAISGETIDYGPCAFLDTYHQLMVFSSIDHAGRYAYGRQPDVGMWNLAQLASALLPLIGDKDAAQAAIDGYVEAFGTAWLRTFRAKIGLQTEQEGDAALIHDLMARMAEEKADFTNTFRALAMGNARDQFLDPSAFDDWEVQWKARLAVEDATPDDRFGLREINPAVIPRNHRIEEAIQAAVAGNFAPFERLNRVLSNPFELGEHDADLARPPLEEERVTQTFCGT